MKYTGVTFSQAAAAYRHFNEIRLKYPSDLINAKTTPGGGDEYAADAVSRATISTVDVMKYAAIQALQGEPQRSQVMKKFSLQRSPADMDFTAAQVLRFI